MIDLGARAVPGRDAVAVISHGFCAQMGGEFTIDTPDGGGAVLTMRIPAKVAARPSV